VFGRPYINVTILKEVFSDMPEVVEMLLSSGHTHNSGIRFNISPLTISLATRLPKKIRKVAIAWETVKKEFNKAVDRLTKSDIESLDLERSIKLLDDILNKLLFVSMTHFQSVILGEVLFNVLVEFLIRMGVSEPNDKATALVGGSIENATVKTNLELYKLSEEINNSNELKKYLFQVSDDYKELISKFETSTPEQKFIRHFQNFLTEFGHRDPVHNFMFPSWRENPGTVISLIKSLVESKKNTEEIMHIKGSIEKRIKTENEVMEFLSTGPGGIIPWKVYLFKIMLRYSRIYMTLRENQQFTIGRMFPLVRQTLIHIGELLYSDGILDSPFESFFMTHAEFKELAKPITNLKLHSTTLPDRVLKRLIQYYVFTQLEPPERLTSSHYTKLKSSIINRSVSELETLKTLTGVPVSAGMFKGPARILLGPNELHKFKSGEILVCPTTNPAWTPIFPLAGALVTDIGGMLSHGAVVAREYRVPAVLGTGKATAVIKTGDILEVDGSTGTVKIL
jgi:pyruvate,water dikinase